MPIALLRFVIFQIVWWLLVLSPKFDASTSLPVSSALSLLVAFLASFWILRGYFQSLPHALVVLTAVAGYLIDSLFVTYGVLQPLPIGAVTESVAFKFAPLWLLGLWLAFAAVSFSTVTAHSSKYFHSKKSSIFTLVVLAVLGAIGGPISYAVGQPLEVLLIGSPEGDGRIFGLLLLAFEWMVMFPLILILSWRAKKEGR